MNTQNPTVVEMNKTEKKIMLNNPEPYEKEVKITKKNRIPKMQPLWED